MHSKLSCYAVVVLCAFGASARAALLAHEPFNYPVGNITDATVVTGSGFTGNWARDNDNLGDYGAVAAGSLAKPNVPTSFNKLENGHNRLTAQLDTAIAGPFAAHRDASGNIGLDGTSLYLGFLMKFAPAPTTGFVAFELFRDGDLDANRRLTVDTWSGHTGGGSSNIWLTGWIPPGTVEDGEPLIATDAATHLFVLKLNFGALNADTVAIYVDPDVTLGEPASPTAIINVTDVSFDRVLTSNFGNTLITADEIRFATTFLDAIPEPSTAVLCLASCLALLRRRSRTT